MPEQRVAELYKLQSGDSKQITVYADATYSGEKFEVGPGEDYSIEALPDQQWVDWWIPSSPNGFRNLLAIGKPMRVRTAKCLCLCAAVGEQDEGAVAIGEKGVVSTGDGFEVSTLSFFANDVDIKRDNNWFRRNNRGSIRINVKRKK